MAEEQSGGSAKKKWYKKPWGIGLLAAGAGAVLYLIFRMMSHGSSSSAQPSSYAVPTSAGGTMMSPTSGLSGTAGTTSGGSGRMATMMALMQQNMDALSQAMLSGNQQLATRFQSQIQALQDMIAHHQSAGGYSSVNTLPIPTSGYQPFQAVKQYLPGASQVAANQPFAPESALQQVLSRFGLPSTWNTQGHTGFFYAGQQNGVAQIAKYGSNGQFLGTYAQANFNPASIGSLAGGTYKAPGTYTL